MMETKHIPLPTPGLVERLHAIAPSMATELTMERLAFMQEIVDLKAIAQTAEKMAGAIAHLKLEASKQRSEGSREAASWLEVATEHLAPTLAAYRKAVEGGNHED